MSVADKKTEFRGDDEGNCRAIWGSDPVDKMAGRARKIVRDGVIALSTDRCVSHIDDCRTLSPGTGRVRARKRAGWQGPALDSLRKPGDPALISLPEQARDGRDRDAPRF